MFRILSSLSSRLLLFLLGWRALSKEEVSALSSWRKVVAVYPHTSYYDFFFVTLYYASYPEIFEDWYTLVKPQVFHGEGQGVPLLGRWINSERRFIPATRVEDKNGGAVERISNILKDKKFVLMISPKGTIVKKPWRTGWWNIAKKTGAMIAPVGLNYHTREPYVCAPFLTTENMEEDKSRLEGCLRSCTPKDIDRSEYTVDVPVSWDPDGVVIDPLPLHLVLLFLLCFFTLSPSSLFLVLPFISAAFFHHKNREAEPWCQDYYAIFAAEVCVVLVVRALFYARNPVHNVIVAVISSMLVSSTLSGNRCESRSTKYVLSRCLSYALLVPLLYILF